MPLAMEHSDIQPESTQPSEKSFFGIIIHSFFVVPFLIAVFAVLLFAAVRILTIEQHTVYDYLNDVKTGGLSKRWQSAFELSKILANPKLIPADERFYAQMTSAFEASKHDDNRVRQYMALAMGRTGDERYADSLLPALTDEKEENLYALIYALGMLQSKKAILPIEKYLGHPNSKIRLISVIALGNIGEPQAIPKIKKALFDSEPNVQWDAAIALAKLKDPSGKNILLKLLDRQYLSNFSEVDGIEQNHMLLVAIEASAHLNDSDLNGAIRQLAQNDQNMNVRKAALAVVK